MSTNDRISRAISVREIQGLHPRAVYLGNEEYLALRLERMNDDSHDSKSVFGLDLFRVNRESYFRVI